MNNWSSDENEAMRGYIIYAAKLLNTKSDKEVITEDALKGLLNSLYRATDELTADEARNYYLNNKLF